MNRERRIAPSLPWLAHAAPLRAPGPALRPRLQQALASLTPDRVEVRASTDTWAPGAVSGLTTKCLLRDVCPGRRTALGRLAAGARYPGHLHAGSEELYVLTGDLLVQGHPMGPGDFCAAEAGTIHQAVRSEAGSLFVMAYAEDDRPSDAPATGEAGLLFAMAAAAAWLPCSGGRRRLLFRDEATGRETTVLRAAERAQVAAGAGTQFLVLDGEVEVDGARLQAGDFRYTAAAAHLAVAAQGSLLLIDSPPFH